MITRSIPWIAAAAIATTTAAGCSPRDPAQRRQIWIEDAETADDDAGGAGYGDAGYPIDADGPGGSPDGWVVVHDADLGDDDSSPDAGGPGDPGGGPPDAGAGQIPDARPPPDARAPDAQPDARPPKPHIVACAEIDPATQMTRRLTTVATIKGLSREHHVSRTNQHVAAYLFRTDAFEDCSRNWCQDDNPPGVYFTLHGGAAKVTWTTACVPGPTPDAPCVADIQEAESTKLVAWQDHNGEAEHGHVDFFYTGPPKWRFRHTCAFSGDVPNIHHQAYCNTSIDPNQSFSGDHIAYGMLYTANHSGTTPVSFSFGVVAGPTFLSANFSPSTGTGQFGASAGWVTQMACRKVKEVPVGDAVLDVYEPFVLRTRRPHNAPHHENGTFTHVIN